MGALKGIRVVEMAGIGPGPFCAMMLADMGAEVIRLDRLTEKGKGDRANVLNRGRQSLAIDLKKPQAVEAVLRLIDKSDVLIEGFRPGVMERLGLGPDICLTRNPGLVYGRMTGWGQEGPLAQTAGHDINYIALTGALGAMGYSDRPPSPPLNLVGDFGGGALYLLAGILAALIERFNSGQGQVIDAAMIDGAASLLSPFFGLMAMQQWSTIRQSNRLDGGAYFYACYECADGGYISIGSLEPKFYALLLEKCGLDATEFGQQHDKANWPERRKLLEQMFKRKTRQEWCELLEGSDVCFAPVLDMNEAPKHPHNKARQTFVDFEGTTQPAPAPRFSRTPGSIQSAAAITGQHSEQILSRWGFSDEEISALHSSGAL